MKFIWEQLDIFLTQIQRRNCATLQSAALFLRRPVSLTSGAHTSTSSYCVIGTASNKPVNWPRFSGELEDKPKINVNPIPAVKNPKLSIMNKSINIAFFLVLCCVSVGKFMCLKIITFAFPPKLTTLLLQASQFFTNWTKLEGGGKIVANFIIQLFLGSCSQF